MKTIVLASCCIASSFVMTTAVADEVLTGVDAFTQADIVRGDALTQKFALTRADMELLANARFGPADGKARYWYATGPVRDADTGETESIFAYYDTTRHIVDPKNPNRHYALISKLDFWRDRDTYKLIDNNAWLFPYQLMILEYKDGKVHFTVTQGKGESLRAHEFPNMYVQRFGNKEHGQYAVISLSGFFKVRNRPELPGTVATNVMSSNFVIREDGDPAATPILIQSSTGTSVPPDGGRISKTSNSSVFARYDNFTDLPEDLQEVINSKYPAWRNPPKDLAAVRAMQ